MPDVLRVRYLGDATATISLVGREVAPDCVFDVPGRVVEDADDHLLIEAGSPPQRWALPKSIYAIETPARKTKTTSSEE